MYFVLKIPIWPLPLGPDRKLLNLMELSAE